MKIEVNYSNKAQATIDLDPSTFRKVTMDPERAYDTRVRITFKDGQEPLDLFFPKPDAQESPGPLGPFVTHVTVFRPGEEPAALKTPEDTYDTMRNLFLHGETDGQKGTEGTEGKRGYVHVHIGGN